MRRCIRLAAADLFFAATIVADGTNGPDGHHPGYISERIVAALAGADLDAFAANAAKYMAPEFYRAAKE